MNWLTLHYTVNLIVFEMNAVRGLGVRLKTKSVEGLLCLVED